MGWPLKEYDQIWGKTKILTISVLENDISFFSLRIIFVIKFVPWLS